MSEPAAPSSVRALRWAVASMSVVVLGLGVAIAFKVSAGTEAPAPRIERPLRPEPLDPPPPTPAAKPVELTLETRPPGATLRVDGRDFGTSPVQEYLPPGEHLVEATLEGYAPASRKFYVTNQQETVTVELTPLPVADAGAAPPVDAGTAPVDAGAPAQTAPDTPPPPPVARGRGKLTLRTKPRATVYFNGRAVGDTPLINLSVPAGTHVLRLVRTDTNGEAELEVVVKPNRTTAHRFTFPGN